MGEYIGFDVSMKDTSIAVRRAGKRVWRGKCASDPEAIARIVRKHAPNTERVVFETGPLSVWFICVDARYVNAALDMAANKTDTNGADGLAHLAEVGFYREVRVKDFEHADTHACGCPDQAGPRSDRDFQPDPRPWRPRRRP